MRGPILDSTEDGEVKGNVETLPKSVGYPIGVNFANQLYTPDKIGRKPNLINVVTVQNKDALTTNKDDNKKEKATFVDTISNNELKTDTNLTITLDKEVQGKKETVKAKEPTKKVNSLMRPEVNNKPKILNIKKQFPTKPKEEPIIPKQPQNQNKKNKIPKTNTKDAKVNNKQKVKETPKKVLENNNLNNEIKKATPIANDPLELIDEKKRVAEEEQIDVIYDPVFKCYYEPKTNTYYQDL